MFDLVTKHKRVAQVILFLLMVPFAFFGVDFYFRGGGGEGTVARSAATRSRRRNSRTRCASRATRCAGQMGSKFDPAMFDTPEVRFALLECWSTSG